MRSIVLGVLVAAGIGMLGTAPASAAPASGITLGSIADAFTSVEEVQYRRRHRYQRRHWSGPRCRLRCNPYGRCWRVCR